MQGFDCYIEKLNTFDDRYNRLCELLTFEEVLVDKKLFLKLSAEKRQLEDIVQIYNSYKNLQTELNDLNELKNLSNNQTECADIKNDIESVEIELEKLKLIIIQTIIGYNSEKENICVEIVSSKDKVANQLLEYLAKTYSLWCENHAFDFNCQREDDTCKLFISGNGIGSVFSSEIGRHKMIDSDNLYCDVFVYNINKDIQYKFSSDELSIEICRSSGAGGQHINTTDSAVRVTHIPTSISAICQDERNQLQNKTKAIERLKEKVEKAVSIQNNDSIKKQKKPQLAKLKLGESVRVYDFKNNILIDNKEKYYFEEFERGEIIRK